MISGSINIPGSSIHVHFPSSTEIHWKQWISMNQNGSQVKISLIALHCMYGVSAAWLFNSPIAQNAPSDLVLLLISLPWNTIMKCSHRWIWCYWSCGGLFSACKASCLKLLILMLIDRNGLKRWVTCNKLHDVINTSNMCVTVYDHVSCAVKFWRSIQYSYI